MMVRAFRDSDLAMLRSMERGLPYPQHLENLEELLVVVDENDQAVMACAAERIVQLYLWVGELSPASKVYAMRLLHERMAPELRAKGYVDVNAFLPADIAVRFGRRLERSFAWVRNWPSWYRRL